MKYTIALETAKWLVKRLGPYTRRIEIAGSLRRQKAYVGDIEIVCIPRIARAPDWNWQKNCSRRARLPLLATRLLLLPLL